MSPTRPEPRFENGFFVPASPVPNPRHISDYKLRHSLLALPVLINNPLETFIEDHYKLDVLQFSMMGSAITIINSPEMIKHCFIDNRENYRFSGVRQSILRTILGDGILTQEGEPWKHARRAMSPLFTPKNVKSFSETMRVTTVREMPDLFETGGVLKIAPLMSALTYLVLSDTLFSGDIKAQKSRVLEDVSTALTYAGRPDPLDLFGAPDWMPRLTKIRGLKAVKNLRKMITDVTRKRQTQKEQGEDLPDDFLTRLLNVGDAETRAFTQAEVGNHILAFIGAGHETTARALSWLFYLLSQDTKSRDRMEAEVDTLDIENTPVENWGEHLPFATACFEETMRLFPPAPLIARETIAHDEKNGTTLNKNDVLMVNCWVMHRHESFWDSPNSFNPERFLGENRKDIGRFQYLPFGVGERVCIGQRFAIQEALILITLLARRYRFDYASDTPPWPKMRITVQPDNDMPMTVTKREERL